MGGLAPLVALAAIIVSISISPWFDWFDNALSDLGNYDNGIVAAIIFNAGLVVTGVLVAWFVVWLLRRTSDVFTKVGFAIFLVSTIGLLLIGVFSENAGRIHFFVSVLFFFSFPFAMWTIGLSWLRFPGLRWFAVLSIVEPFESFYLWWITFGRTAPWTGVAIPEILTALSAIVWLWIIILLLRRNDLSVVIPS